MRATMLFTKFYRSANRTFDAPLQMAKSRSNRGYRDSIERRPISQDPIHSKGSQMHIIATITRLFGSGCPFYIAAFVMAVVVYPFKRIRTTRTFTNFVQEIRKRFKAKLNTTTPIMMVRTAIWISTSVDRGTVALIRRPLTLARSISVDGRSICTLNAYQASTGLRMLAAQVVGGHDRPFAAVTPTQPLSLLAFHRIASKPNYVQSVKLPTAQINGATVRIGCDNILNSHDAKVTPFVELVRAALVRLTPLRPVFILPQIGEKSYA